MLKHLKFIGLAVLLLALVGVFVSSQSDSVVQAQGKVYKLAIFEDLTSVNTLAVLGPKSSVWNTYIRFNGWGSGLFGFNAKFSDYIPGLADISSEDEMASKDSKTGMMIDPATKTATIKIKKGVKWFDPKTGKEIGELTADDVAFSYNAIVGMKGGPTAMGGNWPGIINPDFLKKPVEVVDKYTVKFTLELACSYDGWEQGLLTAPIISKAYWGPKFEAAAKSADPVKAIYEFKGDDEPVVGEWLFRKWEPGAFAESAANKDHYFFGAKSSRPYAGGYTEEKSGVYKYTATTKTAVSQLPYDGDPGSAILDKDKATVRLDLTTGPFVDSTQWRIFGDQATAVAALIKGDVHYILQPLGVAGGFRKQLKEAKGIGVAENEGNGLYYMSFNMRREPFNIKEFRQAISIMIDREFVINQLLAGLAVPAYTIVPTANKAWQNAGVKKLGQGLKEAEKADQAVKLLKSAGFSWEVEPKVDVAANKVTAGRGLQYKGKPVKPFELMAPHQGYDPLRATFALHIEERANKIGIPLKANLTGFNNIQSRVFDEQNFDTWILGWSLGGVFPSYLRSFFHSQNSGLGGQNPQGFNNPVYDKLADDFSAACEQSQLKQLSAKMQEMLADELPYVPLFFAPLFEAFRADALAGNHFPYEKVFDGLQGSYNGLLPYVQLK